MEVCFIGHKTIEKNEELVSLIKETVITLIKKGATNFLFGSMSEFDNLCWETVTELKNEYSFIKRIYVRSAYQHIDKSYKNHLLKFYEGTYFPPRIKNAGKYSYVERNREMIDKASCCVFYYNENYIPALKQTLKNKALPSRRNSGTKIAYEYALKNKKEIINLYKEKTNEKR